MNYKIKYYRRNGGKEMKKYLVTMYLKNCSVVSFVVEGTSYRNVAEKIQLEDCDCHIYTDVCTNVCYIVKEDCVAYYTIAKYNTNE